MDINEVIDKCDVMREEIDGTERYDGLSYTVMRCIEFAYLEGLKKASGLVLIDPLVHLLSKKTLMELQQIRQTHLLEYIEDTQNAVENRQLEEDKELFES